MPVEKKIALSFVIDNKPKFIEQGERLLLSLWHVGMLPSEEVDVYVQYPACMDVDELSFYSKFGICLVPYTPYTEPEAAYCNKLSQLDNTALFSYGHVILLDADVFLLESLVPLCRGEAVRSKPVDMPNPPMSVWHSLVESAGLDDLTHHAAPSFTPDQTTPLFNCNGGLYVMRGCDLERLAPGWRNWAMFCLDQAAILGRWAHHADQLGFALAMLESRQPRSLCKLDFEPLPAEWNVPTHLPEKHYRNVPSLDVKMLHYHDHLDQDTGLLKTTGVEWVDEAILHANHVLTSSDSFPQGHMPEPVNSSRADDGMLLLAFHRSLSSSLANWLHHAGLNMGQYLMPPAVSNPDGHYEDMPLVDLHDRLLRLNGTDWRFHDEGELDPGLRLDLLKRYVRRRTVTTKGAWGAKDPRACLFLPA